MKKDQLTCKQRVTVTFNFYPQYHQSDSVISLKKWHRQKNNLDSKSIRELGAFLSERLEHIAQMIEILQSVHEQWVVTGKRDRVILETDSFDVHLVVNALAEQGFLASDYQLFVEYERKWGIL